MNLKNLKNAVLCVVFAASFTAFAADKRSPEAEATFRDVEKTLGVVPAMVKDMPDENVAPFWEQLKTLQLNPKTALSGKDKELIGLGVAAQVPCRYCVYAHKQFAKLNGANDAEQREAVAAAGLARELSAIANGPESTSKVTAPELQGVFTEIEKAFGTTPEFLKRYPTAALPSLWKQMKAHGMLSAKLKSLISLAVVSQLPSASCVKDYTGMARANGATEQEIQEAVAMAGLTRSASTVLNGSMPDENAWRRDVDSIVKFVTTSAAKKTAAR